MTKFQSNAVMLLILGTIGYFTVKNLHRDANNIVVAADGAQVLSKWNTYFETVTKPATKSLKGNTELYGYFFAVNPNTTLEMTSYHFEERRWMMALSQNFNEFFTEVGLARDFDRLWKFLVAVNTGKIEAPGIRIIAWEYQTEPYVSVAFNRNANGTWSVWVRGFQTNPE